MINRELIRIKLVQVLYSYLQKGSHNPDACEKELLLSLDKAYDLYNYLLMLMVEVSRMSVRMLEVHENRSKKLKDGIVWSHKFVDNRFIIQLIQSPASRLLLRARTQLGRPRNLRARFI